MTKKSDIMHWLHISDIHYNPDQDGRTSEQLREQLPNYLKQVLTQLDVDCINEVFVTGDFRHARYQEDTDSVADASVALLRELAASVGVYEPEHIHIVPGNHDLNRFSGTTEEQKLDMTQEAYRVGDGKFAPDDAAWLLERFSFFKRVSGKMHTAAPVWPDNLQPIHTYRCFDDFNLLYMNTAITCNKDDDRGQLVIGNYDLYKALKGINNDNPNTPIIVLAHHSPEAFSKHEREAVEKLLSEYGVKLYLCGDAHKVWHRRINRTLEITMGCIKMENGAQAAFSVGKLYPDGRLSVYAYHWDFRMGGWGPYTQFNDSIAGIIGQKDNDDFTVEDKQTEEFGRLPLALEKHEKFLFSYKKLDEVFKSHLKGSELLSKLKEHMIPVMYSAEQLEQFIKKYSEYLIVPYLQHKDETGLLKSTSSMHMNWLWPNLLYVPVNIAGNAYTELKRLYQTATKYNNVIFFNHAHPHKSNGSMQLIYGDKYGDYLVRNGNRFKIVNGNGQAFVKMVRKLSNYSIDFNKVVVLIIGVGGTGELAAGAIAEEAPKKLILCDIKPARRELVQIIKKKNKEKNLSIVFYNQKEDIPDLKGERLVILDATNHSEEFEYSLDALDLAKKYDSEGNIFIDLGMNTAIGFYNDKLHQTHTAVGQQYVATTNELMVQEIIDAAETVGIHLSPITNGDFNQKVMKSVDIRTRIESEISYLGKDYVDHCLKVEHYLGQLRINKKCDDGQL